MMLSMYTQDNNLVPHPLRPNANVLCVMCGTGRPVEEIIVNWGLCNDCFEQDCPCHENRPDSCPLHRYPDVVLSFKGGGANTGDV